MAIGRELALQHARRRGVPEDLFLRLVTQESRWNPNAVSPVGAQGLGQVMPATAKSPGFGIQPLNDPFDPNENLRFSADYLGAMLDRYNGDQTRAAAAYNWGAGNADKWNGDLSSLPAETRDYVQKVALGGGGTGGDRAMLPVGQGGSVADMALPALPPTLLDQKASGNSPVTLADIEMAQEGNKFHPGMALQSIGAAIAAGSQGQSAAEALANIRNDYFSEQDKVYAKQREQLARQAAVDIVGGPDSVLGQALMQGVPLDQVMQTYAMERGFQMEGAMQARDIASRQGMQQAEFGQQERMAGVNDYYTRGQMGVQQGMNLERDALGYSHNIDMANIGYRYDSMLQDDAQEASSLEAARDRQFRTGERLGAQLYEDAAARRDNQWTTSENRLNREADESQFSRTLAQQQNEFKETLATSTNAGAAGREAIARAQEASGDVAGAQQTRAMPETAFSDPSMVNAIFDTLKQASPSDAAQKINEVVALSSAARAVEATDPELAAQLRRAMPGGAGPQIINENNLGANPMRPFVEADAKTIGEMTAQLPQYSQAEAALEAMSLELARDPDLGTGALYALVQQPLSVLASTGLLGQDFREDQAGRSAIDRANFILASASKMPGAVSNYEQQTYKLANIGVATDSQRIRNDIELARNGFARKRAETEYIAMRVRGSVDQDGGLVSVPQASQEWQKMVKEGDPRTMPIVKNLDTFTEANLAKLGGIKVGDMVYAGGKPFIIEDQDDLDELNAILNSK